MRIKKDGSDLGEFEILDQATGRHAMEILEDWCSSNHAIKRLVDLDHVYVRMKGKPFT